MLEVWFWQRIVTPHMMALAVALAELDVQVTYVAQERMSAHRKQQGWMEPKTGSVLVEIANDKKSICKLVDSASADSAHICQGIRANGLVCVAQSEIQTRGLNLWVIMETVKDVGLSGLIKRIEYGRLFRKQRNAIAGVLAIGYRTPNWVIQRGVSVEKVFPFAYFLEKSEPVEVVEKPGGMFRFVFVGQFIPGKRLAWLLTALAALGECDFELVIIGSGPLEDTLRNQARDVLGDKVEWIGRLPSSEVRRQLVLADCLVLPSLYDGWGAVVTEALMCGTAVICSDACGSADIVNKSRVGGVFNSRNVGALQKMLERTIRFGRVTAAQRIITKTWSRSIGAEAGAEYLLRVLKHSGGKDKPPAPWDNSK